MNLDRQQATWETRKLRDVDTPLFTHFNGLNEDRVSQAISLPGVPELRQVERDYDTTGVTLRQHPLAFLRFELKQQGAVTADQLADEKRFPQGARVAVAGICLVRQRPGSANQITFITLEDETGTSNLVVYPDVFEREKRVARHATAMLVHGRIDRAESVVHVRAFRFTSLDDRFRVLRDTSRNFH